MPMPQQGINSGVDQQQGDPEDDLQAAGQVARVDDRYQVAGDEIAGVAGFAGCVTKMPFQGGQGTAATGHFDRESPGEAGEMEPGQPWPAQYQQSAGGGEQDEAEVQQDDDVGNKGGSEHLAIIAQANAPVSLWLPRTSATGGDGYSQPVPIDSDETCD